METAVGDIKRYLVTATTSCQKNYRITSFQLNTVGDNLIEFWNDHVKSSKDIWSNAKSFALNLSAAINSTNGVSPSRVNRVFTKLS